MHQPARSILYRHLLPLLGGLAGLALVAGPALALPPPDPQALALTALEAASASPVRIRFEHGFPVVIRAKVTLSGADAESRARSLLTSFPDLFRQSDAKMALRLRGVLADDADEIVSFTQTYAGLPVFDCALTVVNREPVVGTATWTLGLAVGQLMVDDVLPLDLDVIPAVSAASAEAAARSFLARPGAEVRAETTLGIINPDCHDITGSPHLAYRVTLGGGAPHRLYVDAHTLAVDFEHTLVEDAYADFDLDLEHAHNNNIVDTDCFWSTTDDEQIGDEDGVDPDFQGDNDAVAAYHGIKHIANWYYDVLGRRSVDDDDEQIEAYVHSNFETDFPNARWAHPCGMEFTEDMVGYDVAAHEFSHGVIRYSFSDLIYKNQSGALNESYADTMASFADAQGDWLVGEDTINGQGPLRSLADPPGPWCGMGNQSCGQPDKLADYVFTASDNGGVHTNSGIPNKAHFLISEGGIHNGLSISGIGKPKARRLVYLPMRVIPAGSTFLMAANITAGIAESWAETGKYGFTAADACQVRNAWAAVEIIESVDLNCDGVPDSIDDADDDRIVAADDNCPYVSNPGQADRDDDGIGDVCDTDSDGDGWPNEIDNCPNDYQPGYANVDLDGDGFGNGCDDDDDGDNVLDGDDNCPDTPNPDQLDSCGSPLGDACDVDHDSDGDGLCVSQDNCPLVYNPGNIIPSVQADADGDGLGDACDACPNVADNTHAYTTAIPEIGLEPKPWQPDSDGDGTPDACDTLGFGGAGLLVGGDPYNPAEPLEASFFPSALDISGSAGDVIEVTLPVCPDTGRPTAGPDDRVELVFTGLEDDVEVAVLDESGAAIASSVGPVPAGRGLRFRPDCVHTYRLRLRLGTGFSGSDSASLLIDNAVAAGANPWTATPGLGFPPPPPLPDTDGDGIIDAIDRCPLIPDPTNYDTDLDGDGNACDVDDDDDGLLDTVETSTMVFVDENDTGSSPTLWDSDGDGVDDGTEVAMGTDPNDPLSFPVLLPLLAPWSLAALIGLLASLGGLAVRRRGRHVRVLPAALALLLVASADPASAVNYCHEFRAQLKNEANVLIASAGGYSSTSRLLAGTLQPGRYYITVTGVAASSVDFNDVPNPGYCNVSGDLLFDLVGGTSADPGWDETWRRVIVHADAELATPDDETAEIFHTGDASMVLGAQVSSSNQLGSTFARVDSSFSASPNPSGLDVSLDILSYGSNQFMAGFPGPVGTTSSIARWKFSVSQPTDWTLDLQSEVDEGPPTSVYASLLPLAWYGEERIYAVVDFDNPIGVIVEPGPIELVLEDGSVELIIETELPAAQIDTTEYEVVIESGSLGIFPAESVVDFVALSGDGVPGFRLVPQGDSGGIPLTLYELDLAYDAPPTHALRVIPVPEPSRPASFAAGLLLLALMRRGREKVGVR